MKDLHFHGHENERKGITSLITLIFYWTCDACPSNCQCLTHSNAWHIRSQCGQAGNSYYQVWYLEVSTTIEQQKLIGKISGNPFLKILFHLKLDSQWFASTTMLRISRSFYMSYDVHTYLPLCMMQDTY